MKTLKLGLVGCGRIAQIGHLGALLRLRDARVVALSDTDAVRLRTAAASFPQAGLFPDYRDFINRYDIDAAVIALPTALHADAAVAAFEAGKHVYVEKPLATSLGEARRVLEAQAHGSTIGMIGFNLRFHPLYQTLRREVRAGRVGRVVGVRTVFCATARQLPVWKTRRLTGGSALLDLASHHIDLLRFVFDQQICDAAAETSSLLTEDDTAALQMRLVDGTPVQTFVSMTSAEDDRFEVLGEAGTLTVDRFRSQLVEFSPSKRARTRLARAGYALALTAATPRRMLFALQAPHERSYLLALQAFVDAANSGADSPVGLEEGYESLAVVTAAERSLKTGRRELVPHLRVTPAPAPQGSAPEDVPAGRPAISVVVVTPDRFKTLRRTVRFLRGQTLQSQIELILVGPTAEGLGDREASETEGFFAVRTVAAGSIVNVDKVAAHGIRQATAPVVALLEDHAYPEATWAEALIDAHKGPWSVVGSTFLNANPSTAISWTNLLLAYGTWVPPVEGGETRSISRHNISFKRSALAEFDGELESLLGRDGGLMPLLLKRGHRFYLEPRARILHANLSRVPASIRLRFGGGRISASARAAFEGWSFPRRFLYAAAAPAFPVLRARLLFGKVASARRSLWIYPSLAIGLIADGIGQGVGFLVGSGNAARELEGFERDRLRYVTAADRQQLEE